MILIHVPNSTERWSYTLDFIFGLHGVDFKLTDSKQIFDESTKAKISFQNWELGTILYEKGLTALSISKENWNGVDCLAFNGTPDPISSIFYVLTRMEEYHNSKWDSHNRFEASSSVQSQYGWLEKCICDRWAESTLSEIEKRCGISFSRKTNESQLIPTFDIDNTYAYLLKTGKRKFLSIAKDLVFLNFKRLKERNAVLSEKVNDPYNTFQFISRIAVDFPVRLFWLVGDYGRYDKNIAIEDKQHTQLVKQLSVQAEIGIHPSYLSNSIPILLKTEKERLEKAYGNAIRISRQHFLKLKFPQTYENALNKGIREDYTMGFADKVGFRNGTARSFPWFNLSINKTTDLIIKPFAYMDGTLNEYLELKPEIAKKKINELFEEVSEFGGDFIFIWHNETIGDYGKWKGWRSVLEYTLSLNSQKK